MRAHHLPLIAIGAVLAVGCSGTITDPDETLDGPITTFNGSAAVGCSAPNPRTVLVDPTHDGGVWWFPQSSSFDASKPHQGAALANLLRARGYTVTELGRGATMSPDSMMKYSVIIRAGYYYDARHPGYSAADLEAYTNYAACERTLIILAEYLRDGRRDDLAEHFGIPLEGMVTDTIRSFGAHPITAGVTPMRYIAGSYLANESNQEIEVLGRIGTRAVMGVLGGRAAKIFFIGDTNGIQLLPQPLVDNLIGWGF